MILHVMTICDKWNTVPLSKTVQQIGDIYSTVRRDPKVDKHIIVVSETNCL